MILMFLFCMFFTVSMNTVAAKEPIDQDDEATTESKTDITGYGEYVLGTSVSDLDMSEFEGPIRDTSYEDLEAYNYVQVGREFNSSAGSTDITLMLSFVDNRLSLINLDFSNIFLDFNDLDRVSRFVRELRSSFLEKYDHNIIDMNTFYFDYNSSLGDGWLGSLVLIDDNGNQMMLIWNGYDLTIVYVSSGMLQIINELSEAEAEEEENRL